MYLLGKFRIKKIVIITILVVSVVVLCFTLYSNLKYTPPKPIGYILPPMAEILPPKPSASEFMFIFAPDSPTGYLVKNSKTISTIKEEHKRYIENFYCGCGIKGVVGDHDVEFDIFGFGGGWIIDRLPFFEDEVASDFSDTVHSAIVGAETVFIYDFMANAPHSHGEIMNSIESKSNMYAFYVGYNLTEQYSFISLEYSYDNLYNNEKGEYPESFFKYESKMGRYACDDVFIPIIDYLREQENLYQVSTIRERRSSYFHGLMSFRREITLHLNNPITQEENERIKDMWLSQTKNKPYSNGVYAYKEITQYPIRILSEQTLSDAEIRELEQIYNLNYVGNPQ